MKKAASQLHAGVVLRSVVFRKVYLFIVTAERTLDPKKIHPIVHWLFFLFLGGGVRLSPLGTSATNWPIVPAPDDR
jgi:hypothetical protein